MVFGKKVPFVYPVNPKRLNERVTVQQGVFLNVGDPSRSFVENLRALQLPKERLWKIRIENKCRRDVLLPLHRMGVNRAALFPGLDGFAGSLHTKMLLLQYRRSQID
jgi:hypothetical protein